MALHLPVHPVHFADRQVMRNMLVAIFFAAVAIVGVYAAATTEIGTTTTTTPTLTEMERMIEFRAGERAPLAVQSESQRMIEFRASERADWPTLAPGYQP